jgi:hypothetical protein
LRVEAVRAEVVLDDPEGTEVIRSDTVAADVVDRLEK